MDLLSIGILQRNHGIKGAFKVKSFSGENEHFFRLKDVFIRTTDKTENLRVEWVKEAPKNLLIKFQGIDSPEAGKKYRNLEIWVDRQYACPVKKGEYYLTDIIKCKVCKGDEIIGKVKSVFGGGIADIIEVIDIKGEIINIPFSHHFIKDVDLQNHRLYVNLESPLF